MDCKGQREFLEKNNKIVLNYINYFMGILIIFSRVFFCLTSHNTATVIRITNKTMYANTFRYMIDHLALGVRAT